MWSTDTDPRAQNVRRQRTLCHNLGPLCGGSPASGSAMRRDNSGPNRDPFPDTIRTKNYPYNRQLESYSLVFQTIALASGKRTDRDLRICGGKGAAAQTNRGGGKKRERLVNGTGTVPQQPVCNHLVYFSMLESNQESSGGGKEEASLRPYRSHHGQQSVRQLLKITAYRADTQKGRLSETGRYNHPLSASSCNGCISISGASQ